MRELEGYWGELKNKLEEAPKKTRKAQYKTRRHALRPARPSDAIPIDYTNFGEESSEPQRERKIQQRKKKPVMG